MLPFLWLNFSPTLIFVTISVENTPLYKMFNSNNYVSANAMDTNWGGAAYTEKIIKYCNLFSEQINHLKKWSRFRVDLHGI